MTDLASALYVGRVAHVRTRPKPHALEYRVFMLLLDLDELPRLGKRLKTLSPGPFGLLSFRQSDHGDGSDRPLKRQIEDCLDDAGLGIAGGPIRLLCMPRVLGYVFNPLSIYFCHRPDGALHAVLYEVSSTFGERHSYLIAAADSPGGVRQTVAKQLHVSPFLDMDLRYDFRIASPDERLRLLVDASDSSGVILRASFVAERRDLTDSELMRAWIAHPLLTLKVTAGIHWEALMLLLKGLRLRSGPSAPAPPVTLGALHTRQADRRYSM